MKKKYEKEKAFEDVLTDLFFEIKMQVLTPGPNMDPDLAELK
jgi:hypothetical protein